MNGPEAFVLIGAGSTVFTPGLLHDLVRSGAFENVTVRLVDLVPEAAETMAALGRRIAAENGSQIRIEAVADRREALRGARFVATTIAVGSADGWRRDLEIPERFGVRQTVGDSVGPGGVLRALRHIPELLAIARDIADVAPDAILFNYSNPLTANVRAITRETGIRAVGLCHGAMHTKSALTRALGVDDSDVTATFAGLNHLSWLLDIRTADEDLYPRLVELVEAKDAGIDAPSSWAEGPHAPVSADLMRTFGRYPAPGDRHVSEFFAGYLRAAPGEELRWGMQAGLDATRRYIDEKQELWEGLRGLADGSVPLQPPRAQEAERLISIAAAIRTGRGHVELAVNLPNIGLISNLPGTAVVEVPAVVGADGVRGVAVGALPDGIAAVLTARALQQELTVDAAVRSDRRLALQALVLDPLVPDAATAAAILDAAVAAGGGGMAAFAEDRIGAA
jgi:alpha-galactosidase